MSARRSRFNLLLLEDGEYLLEEYAALVLTCGASPASAGADDDDAPPLRCEARARGRLRLCSRALYFEPDDARSPLLRLAYSAMPGKPTAYSAWPLAPAVPALGRALTAEGARGAHAHCGRL